MDPTTRRQKSAWGVVMLVGLAGVFGSVAVALGERGALAVFLAGWLTEGDLWAVALAVPAVIVGHIWPVQMGFRGGVERLAIGVAHVEEFLLRKAERAREQDCRERLDGGVELRHRDSWC